MPRQPHCSCSHAKVDHYFRGCCKECGCTWYHPGQQYIKNNQAVYAATQLNTLSQSRIKTLCRKVVEYCEQELGKRPHRAAPTVKLVHHNPEKDLGEYQDPTNEIVVFIDDHRRVGQLVSTIIHEYTHYLQPRGDSYNNLLRRWGYADHPYEVEARLNESYYTRRALAWIRSSVKR